MSLSSLNQIPQPETQEKETRTPLGDPLGLTQIGINHTYMPPETISAERHFHSHEDEWVLVLEGHPTLITDLGETDLAPGDYVGFVHGKTLSHQLKNRSSKPVLVLEVSHRDAADEVTYVKA